MTWLPAVCVHLCNRLSILRKSLGKSWSNVSQPFVKWQSAPGETKVQAVTHPKIWVDNSCQTVLICWNWNNWNWWWYSEIKGQRVEILIKLKRLKLQSALVSSACFPTSVAMQQSGDKLIIQSGAQAASCLLLCFNLLKCHCDDARW